MGRLFSIFVLLLLPLLSAVSGEPSAAPKEESGVEGVITVGPIHGGPVRQDVPSSKPLADTEFKVEKQNGLVLSFKTDAKGRFKISLPAGHYTISKKDSIAAGIGNYSFEVDVAPNQMKRVQWECDTGIR